MTDDKKLVECPVCGRLPKLIAGSDVIRCRNVYCSSGTRVTATTRNALIRRWNDRARAYEAGMREESER